MCNHTNRKNKLTPAFIENAVCAAAVAAVAQQKGTIIKREKKEKRISEWHC